MKTFESAEIKSANIVLDYLELGNEPDLYPRNGLRATTYNKTTYVKEYVHTNV